MVDGGTAQQAKYDTGLSYNASTDELTVGSGALSWTLDASSSTTFALRDSAGTAELQVSNAGLVTATTFSGSGSSLTNLPAGQLTGTISSARLPVIPVTTGGTGAFIAPSTGGVIFAVSTSAYSSTAAGTAGQILQSDGTNAPTWVTNTGVWVLVRSRAAATALTSTGATGATGGSLSVGTFAQGDTIMMEVNSVSTVGATDNVPVVIFTLGAADTVPDSEGQTISFGQFRNSSTVYRHYVFKISHTTPTLYFDDAYLMTYTDSATASSILTESNFTLHIGRVWRLVQ
jgi:hypothetical protein